MAQLKMPLVISEWEYEARGPRFDAQGPEFFFHGEFQIHTTGEKGAQ